MSSWYGPKRREALNQIKKWQDYYKDDEKVEFLVRHYLHFSRSPGKKAGYHEWLEGRVLTSNA